MDITLTVHADEDTDLTADEFASEVEFEVANIEGVESVTVDNVFDSTPYRVELSVGYDSLVTDEDAVTYEASTLSFVHNAQ